MITEIVFAVKNYGDGDCIVVSERDFWEMEGCQNDGFDDPVYDQIEADFKKAGIEAYELAEATFEFVGMSITQVEAAITKNLSHWIKDPAFDAFMG